MSKSVRLSIVSVALVLLAVPVFASHAWGNYHWGRTSNPFTLKVHDNLTSVWEPYLAEADADWDASSVLDLNVLWNSPLSGVKRCTSTTGRIEVCNAKYGQNGWLGIAGISISGNHITKGYTKLNDTYFDTPTYNTPAWRRLVTCQEIGHDFGLAHQDETFDNVNLGSCMDYTNDPDGGSGGASNNDPSNEHPNAHDYQQIETIYAHLDSSNTYTSVLDVMAQEALRPPTMEEILADADQWGIPVRFDKQGRPIVFKMPISVDHGDDEHVDDGDGNGETFNLVHVFWAPEDPFHREKNVEKNR
jgi:hypothetical protein